MTWIIIKKKKKKKKKKLGSYPESVTCILSILTYHIHKDNKMADYLSIGLHRLPPPHPHLKAL